MKAEIDYHDILAGAEALKGELSALRAEFHRHPEPWNHEFKTASRIEADLDLLGIPHRRLTETGVLARLDGAQPGRVIALRADMDALPVHEATGAPFSSQEEGYMHACGHDVHVTALLGAARLLIKAREGMRGSVVFIFQPDEESDGGAERMIAAGALDDVDEVYGAHVAPDLPEGHMGVRYGKFYAASDVFRVKVTGRSSHGAVREKGVDALDAACAMARKLLTLPRLDPEEPSVVTVGMMHAGTAVNILPGEATFAGIIRTLGRDKRLKMSELFENTLRDIAAKHGVGLDVNLKHGYSGIVNHARQTEYVRRAAARLLGEGAVHEIEAPTMVSEDFGYYLDERPGSFYHIGAGCTSPLHAPDFLPTEKALVTAAAVHAAVVLSRQNDE